MKAPDTPVLRTVRPGIIDKLQTPQSFGQSVQVSLTSSRHSCPIGLPALLKDCKPSYRTASPPMAGWDRSPPQTKKSHFFFTWTCCLDVEIRTLHLLLLPGTGDSAAADRRPLRAELPASPPGRAGSLNPNVETRTLHFLFCARSW